MRAFSAWTTTFLTCAGALLALGLATPSTALALPPPVSLLGVEAPTYSRVNLEIATYGGGDLGALVVAPSLALEFSATDDLWVAAEWGLFGAAFTDAPVLFGAATNDATAGVGNPTFSFGYQSMEPDAAVRVGAGLTLPVASIDEFGESALVHLLGRSYVGMADGYWDMWRHVVDGMAVFVPVQAERRARDRFILGTEGALAVLFPVRNAADEDNRVLLQLAGYAAVVADPAIIGLRLQLVSMLEGPDLNQVALAPFVQFDADDLEFQVRLLMNVNDLGSEADAWGLHVGGGAKF